MRQRSPIRAQNPAQSLLMVLALTLSGAASAQGEAESPEAESPEAEAPAATPSESSSSAEAVVGEGADPDEPTDEGADPDEGKDEGEADKGSAATAAAEATAEAAAEQPAADSAGAETSAADKAAGVATADVPPEAMAAPGAVEASAAAAANAASMTLEQAKQVVAAAEKADADAKAAAEKKRKEGFWWDRELRVGATALGMFNRSFVGQADGIGLQLGAVSSGKLVLGYQGHRWTNTYDLAEAFVATPSSYLLSPTLSKATDRFTANTEYRYQWPVVPWVGPFVQAQLQTTVFPSWVLRSDTTAVVKDNIDGDPLRYVIGANLPISTTGWFEPVILTETAGAFIEPPAYKDLIVTQFKVAAAAQHQLAWGGHVITDNADTPELELSQVAIVNSLGTQAEAGVSGLVVERVSYALRAMVFYPILALGPGVEDVSLIERTHLELEAKTSVRLAEWLSLDGVVIVRRQPFVLNDWQLQTSLLLTSAFQIL